MSSNQIISTKLKPSAKLVLMALCKFAGKTNQCYPSISTLATTTGLSTRTVIRCINSLVESNYILKEHRKIVGKFENTSNLYTVIMSQPTDKMAVEVKELNTSKDLNTSCLECQNDTTDQNNDDDSLLLKSEIESTIGESIDNQGLQYLVSKSEPEVIKHYLSNWHKFNHVLKINPVGYFIDVVVNKRSIPSSTSNNKSLPYPTQQRVRNFKEREYSDEFYNQFYVTFD